MRRSDWAWTARGLVVVLALAACEESTPLERARNTCTDTHANAADRVAACTNWIDQGQLNGADHAAALAHRGEAHVAKSETTPALRDFEGALALDQNNLVAAYGRASILLDSGQLDAALPLVDRLVAANYQPVQAHTMKGRIAFGRGEYDSAITNFDAALSQNNRFAPALALRGRAKERLGRDADARADYDAAIDADGHRANALAWRCWMEVRLKGDPATAQADAERAVQADPRLEDGHTCLGVVQLKASQWADAKNSFDAALLIQPGDPIALFGRGIARRRGGDGAGDQDMYQAVSFDAHVREAFRAWGVDTY